MMSPASGDIRRAVVMIRTLARHAGRDRSFVEWATDAMGWDPSVARAATILQSGSTWALTAQGERALYDLNVAYRDVLDVLTPAAQSFSRLDASLKDVTGFLRETRKKAETGDLGDIDLVSESDRKALSTFEGELLSVFCYVMAIFYGPGVLQPLANAKLETPDDLRSLETTMTDIKSSVARTPEVGCWTMTRSVCGGSVLPVSADFAIDWSTSSLSTLTTHYGLAQKTPFISTAGAGRKEGVILAGRGNIVGTSPLKSTKLRSAGVRTNMPISALVGANVRPEDPVFTLRSALGGDAFCISPDAYALSLDRWSRVKEVR